MEKNTFRRIFVPDRILKGPKTLYFQGKENPHYEKSVLYDHTIIHSDMQKVAMSHHL